MQSAGWSWNIDGLFDFVKNSPFCNGAPITAYCGFTHPGDLTLSYVFDQSGRIQIDWGQSFASGQVVLRVNGVEIDRTNTIDRKTTEFDVSSGDVFEIAEVNLSVMVMYDIIFTADENVATTTTAMPTMNPTTTTAMPSMNPTLSPTQQPTMAPSLSPTQEPTKEPTVFPTEHPTIEPTMKSTTTTTSSVFTTESASPSKAPSINPSQN